MGMFDFLKRKGKEDELGGDFGLGPEPAFPEAGGGMPGVPSMTAFGGPGMPPEGMPQGMPGTAPVFGRQAPTPMAPMSIQMSQPSYPQQQQQMDTRTMSDMVRNQMDTISYKIDSLRTSIDRLADKLDFIERYLAGRR
jgi:hypothetical protein